MKCFDEGCVKREIEADDSVVDDNDHGNVDDDDEDKDDEEVNKVLT